MRTKTSSSDLEQIEWFASESVRVINEVIRLRKTDILIIETFFNPEGKSCIIKFRINKARLLDVSNYIYFLLDYEVGDMIHHGMRFEKDLKDKDQTIEWIKEKDIETFENNTKVANLIFKYLK
jgi:hypothetical protein